MGKVSAICRACTRAPVHLVQFETGFRRRYHLERSRHFWGNIYLRINRVQFRKRMWMKNFSQGGTSLCSTPKTCYKWEDAGNTPWKVLFRFKDPDERLWKMWHSLDMYKNAIGFIKGCVGWNSLQWSTTSWHGAWQGRANKDQVDLQERGWRLDNDLYQGICEDSQLHSIWLQGAKPRTLPGLICPFKGWNTDRLIGLADAAFFEFVVGRNVSKFGCLNLCSLLNYSFDSSESMQHITELQRINFFEV